MTANPKGGTVHTLVTYTLAGGIGYLGYQLALKGSLGDAMQKAAQQIQATFFPNSGGGGGGNGGSTFEEACAAARSQLIALDGRWATASCGQIKAEVCSNPTLFVGQTGIRKGLGCSS